MNHILFAFHLKDERKENLKKKMMNINRRYKVMIKASNIPTKELSVIVTNSDFLILTIFSTQCRGP